MLQDNQKFNVKKIKNIHLQKFRSHIPLDILFVLFYSKSIMGFLKQAFLFIASPTQPRTLSILVLLLILAAVPLTVVVSQKQQEIRQRAAETQSIYAPECNPPYVGYKGCLTENECKNVGKSSGVDCSDENVKTGIYCYESTNVGKTCSVQGNTGTCNDTGNCVISTVSPTPTLTPTTGQAPPTAAPPPQTTTQALTLRASLQCRPVKTVNLSWNAISGASTYRVWRQTDNEEWDILVGDVGQPGTTSTTYNDNSIDITKKHTYRYYVIALDNTLSSLVNSNAASVDTSVCLPVYPCAINKEPREFYCSASRPDVPNKDQCLDVSESWTCDKVSSDIKNAKCWQCPLPTPTLPPSSECRKEDCGTCAVGSVCAQIGVGDKKCGCREISSLTPTPTLTPPTPTPTRPGGVILALSLALEGIGEKRINLPSRVAKSSATIEVLSHPSETIALTKTDSVIYDSASGKFKRPVDLGTALAPGDYQVKIKIDNYLKKLLADVFTVKGGTTTQTIPAETFLFAGNINTSSQSAKTIDILDYNSVRNCFGARLNTEGCTNKSSADLNFDGTVDIVDLNITLRNFGKTDD